MPKTSPALLTPGMVILHKGRALTLTEIRSSKDPVHVRLWYAKLTDDAGEVNIVCNENARFNVVKED